MGIIYRAAGPDDREAVIDFINYVFSQNKRPHDFKKMLPKEYGDGRELKAVHFLAEDEAKGIRGVTAVRPFTVKAGSGSLSCGFVGSVSVHPYSRGEGHMKKLMAMANQYMYDQGMDLAVLSGRRQRYEYYGYSQGGMRISAEFNRDNFRHRAADLEPLPVTFRKLSPGPDAAGPEETEAVLPVLSALHARQPLSVQRDPAEFIDICRSWERDLYAVSVSGTVKGYLAADKEQNITELVLEDDIPCGPVLAAWQKTFSLNAFAVTIFFWDNRLLETAAWLSEDLAVTRDHNVRVLNWKKTIPLLLELKQQVYGPLPQGEMSLIADGEPVHIGTGERADGNGAAFYADDLIRPGTKETERIALQNRLFGMDGLILPRTIDTAPREWFPLCFCIPESDAF